MRLVQIGDMLVDLDKFAYSVPVRDDRTRRVTGHRFYFMGVRPLQLEQPAAEMLYRAIISVTAEGMMRRLTSLDPPASRGTKGKKKAAGAAREVPGSGVSGEAAG